ncbi:MAG: hypothetical protein DMG92_07400 [Acidobacteria bacterium]|nr:MAG: hypothetical protein DMG92_07400 [Acidobacteriota bacterium]
MLTDGWSNLMALPMSGRSSDGLMFPGTRARGRGTLETSMFPDDWQRLRLCPVAKKLGVPFHQTLQLLRRSFSTHGTKGVGPEVIQMVNGVTDRILGLGEGAGRGSIH